MEGKKIPKFILRKSPKVLEPFISEEELAAAIKKRLHRKFMVDPIQEVTVYYNEFYPIWEGIESKYPKRISVKISGKTRVLYPVDRIEEHSLFIAPRGDTGHYIEANNFWYANTPKLINYVEKLIDKIWNKSLNRLKKEAVKLAERNENG